MANTVNTAFDEFMKDYVNLDPAQVSQARTSRDWLIKQINLFPDKYDDFPSLYEEKHFGFGSFARSTKKRPLDDIDHLICMTARGVAYRELYDGTVQLDVPDGVKPFNTLLQTGSTCLLSSIKVVNRFVKYLDEIPQYEKADINRNQEAATLKLTSYDWNFDVVPCFFTSPETDGRTYYIIPDGNGNWKKTDPSLDKARTTRVNQKRGGHVLQTIRAMKYWNNRPTMASMGSYLIENMILNYYEYNEATQWVDWEVRKLLNYIKNNIFNDVNDPKNIQGNINNLTWEQKNSIYNRAVDNHAKSEDANIYETSNPAYAISKWQSIFGSNFPAFDG
ncbi:MAG: nucleotidyltransferase [Candidatus Sedimenticola sp. (ex Thyasira tokunagai)]